jgi:hypothetical protein
VSDLAARLDALDPDVRAIAKAMWRAHRLPPAAELDAEQAETVHDWLDWILGEGDGWPEREPVELPARFDVGALQLPPVPPDAVLHACGGEVPGYGIRYQRLLRPGDACPDCWLDPGFPIPDLDACRLRLVALLGPADAAVWVRELARLLGKEAA